jgi:hypothetical protein
MNKLLEYLGTIEFIAAYTIWEKYKRSMELQILDLKKLEMVSFYISQDRKNNNKNPNLDFLIQQIQEYLKGKHKDQNTLQEKISKIYEN